MQTLLNKLAQDYPHINFVESNALCWSSEDSAITYTQSKEENSTMAGLLHEIGHARLQHNDYTSDMDLVLKERQAWEEALKLSKDYGVKITVDHIEDCIDTYREWLYKRSLCPNCAVCGLQSAKRTYVCLICNAKWRVTPSRHCRPYRLKSES